LHKGELLHKAGFCGEGMLICVIDAGWNGFDTISYFQPLYANGQIWGTRDLVPGVNNVYTGHSHGTMVTSEMVTTIEGKFAGSAPRANYFFIRSENELPLPNEQLVEEDFFAQAAEIADSLGADVISASLCYGAFDYEWQNIFTPDSNTGMASIASRAVSTLAQKGVIVAIAAGNMGLLDWHYITRPADAKNILAVGMVNKYGVVNSLSSYGPSADGRVKPDVAAAGDDAWVINEYGKIVQLSGTSCAAPIIAGLSASLWQALPQYSSLEITDLIRKYGSRYNNPNYRIGYGIPNFYQCYLDQTFGVTENVKQEVLVYPNPTSGRLHVTSDALHVTDVEVFDIYGRKQSHVSRVTSNEIDISELAAGEYFVKITTETGVVTKKVIKY
jgi:subtilisin family serine protease